MTSSRRVLSVVLVVLAVGCSNKPTGPSKAGTSTSTTSTVPPATNRVPTIGAMTVSPTFGVSGLTLITMNAAASDPDGDPISYSWFFGGASAAGSSTSARLVGDGPVQVQLSVSDGRGGTATDSRTVTVGTMAGNWDFVAANGGTDPRERPAVFTLAQTGGTVTGSLNFPGNWCNANPGTHSEIPAANPGSIDDQGNFSLPRVAIGAFADVQLNGKMDSTGRKVTGSIFNSGFTGEPFVLTKK